MKHSSPSSRSSFSVSKRLAQVNISGIKRMMYWAEEEKKKGKHVISLGVGAPYYRASDFLHEHVSLCLKETEDIDRYSSLPGIPKLRRIIADRSSSCLGFPVSERDILITPGSMAALFYTFLTLLDPGDDVIVPSPHFPSYTEQIALAGGNIVRVPLSSSDGRGYRLDVSGIARALSKKTKIILLNSPHNPTGAVYTRDDLMAVADLASSRGVFIVTDEVYDFLTYDGTACFPIASVRELWPNVIRCCSFSKKYALMGWRIGYLHARSDLITQILKLHDMIIVCAPHVSQQAALSALSGPQDIVSEYCRKMSLNRTLLFQRFDRLRDLFSCEKTQGAYYAFPTYHLPLSSLDMAKRLLFEAGVVTIPGEAFGEGGEKHLRLSFGASPADITEAFDRIETWWKNI